MGCFRCGKSDKKLKKNSNSSSHNSNNNSKPNVQTQSSPGMATVSFNQIHIGRSGKAFGVIHFSYVKFRSWFFYTNFLVCFEYGFPVNRSNSMGF